MKVLFGIFSIIPAFQAYAASPTAFGFTFDPNLESYQDAPSLSPVAARLLFARRLGLSQYHDLDHPDEEAIRHLNDFGGNRDQELLSGGQRTSTESLLIFVENVEHPRDLFDSRFGNALFKIENPPSSPQNLQLAADLLTQDRERRIAEDHSCTFALFKNNEIQGGINNRGGHVKGCSPDTSITDIPTKSTAESLDELISMEPLSPGSTTILHISSLEGISSKDGNRYEKATTDLKLFFQKLHKYHANRPGTTIILLPSQPEASRNKKKSSYGTYTTHHNLRRRQIQPEQPLITPIATKSSSTSTYSPPELLRASSLPNGILPICYSSKELCISHTNNCSGHGDVYPQHKKSDQKNPCWACKCTSTRSTNGKSVKTTHWGGPACQKKDVSAPFFLLAGFSIAILTTVAWAIGLLFSVGQEDLPSVIGAGVAGPRAQK